MSLQQVYRGSPWPGIVILFAVLTLVVFTFTRHRLTTNSRSRIITVERLIEAGTFAHKTATDSTRFELSIDAVMVDGNIYSSKPPNYPLLMAAEVYPIRKITGKNFVDWQVRYVQMLVLLNQVLPYGFMLLIAWAFAAEFTEDPKTLSMLMLAMSFGILPFGYAVTINNHTPAAILFFLSFYLLYLIIGKDEKRAGYFFLLGFLAGFAASIELPGTLFAAFFMIRVAFHDFRRSLWTFAGMVLPFALTIYVYWFISGDPRPFYLRTGLYQYAGSYWQNPESLDAVRPPKSEYLFHMLIGHHGLFSMSPVLLLVFPGLWLWMKEKTRKFKAEVLWMAGISLLVMTYILLRTWNYGGWCIGMRWFVLFTPVWMFFALPAFEKIAQKTWGWLVFGGLLGASAIAVVNALYLEAFMRSWWELWWIDA